MKKKVGFAIALAAMVFGVAVVLLSVRVEEQSQRDEARPADVILVLGAAEYRGKPSPVLKARLDHALALYEQHVAPVIVVTGGRVPGDRFTEATAGATYLHDRGVPDTAILRETQGRSSWESLASAARFLKARDETNVVLVSDPYHAARIDDIAKEVGLDAVASPTRTSPITGADEWRHFGTETLRVAAGRLFGYRRLEQEREMGKVVPGLGMLIPPSGVV